MKGYFAIGAEGISKPMNLGALMRTANAFGASFVFSVEAADRTKIANLADTSRTFKNVPYYAWDSMDEAPPAPTPEHIAMLKERAPKYGIEILV